MGENKAQAQLNTRISADDKERWDELIQITMLSGNRLVSQLIRSLHCVAWNELYRIGLVSKEKLDAQYKGGKIIETTIKVRKCPTIQKKL